MSSPRGQSILFYAVTALLCINTVFKLVQLTKTRSPSGPHHGETWSVDRPPVAFHFDLGLRYSMNSSAEWAALVPGDGLVSLEGEPHTVSMLHQLRCLDVVREQLAKPRALRTEQPARHCMNYIRQMSLCRADTHIDPYQYPSNIRTVERNPIRRCRDWRAVYDAVRRNQREHTRGGRRTHEGRGRSAR